MMTYRERREWVILISMVTLHIGFVFAGGSVGYMLLGPAGAVGGAIAAAILLK